MVIVEINANQIKKTKMVDCGELFISRGEEDVHVPGYIAFRGKVCWF